MKNKPTLLLIGCEEILEHNSKIREGLEKNFVFQNISQTSEAVEFLRNNETILLIIINIKYNINNVSNYFALIAKEGKFLDLPVFVFSDFTDEENKKIVDERVLEIFHTDTNEEIFLHCVATMSKASKNVVALRDYYNNDVMGCLTYKGFVRDYELIIKNSKKSEKFTLILCFVPTHLVLYYRYGLKYAVEMLSKVSDALKSVEDFILVGAASEDMFWVLAKKKDYSEQYFVNLQSEINLKMPLKNFTFKFGVYDLQENEEDYFNAFRYAGIAMQSAKSDDKKVSGYFTEPISKEIAAESNLEEAFDKGIKERKFEVYYQPKVDIDTNTIIGCEGLARWDTDAGGLLEPSKFIHMFEENGIIEKFDLYILEEICKTLNKYKEQVDLIPVSFNLSRVDFRDSLLARKIIDVVEKYEIDPTLIHIELTEMGYFENPKFTINIIKELKNFGIQIEMDNFGNGYTSLNMLSSLPLDYLKIDISYLRNNDSVYNTQYSFISFLVSLVKWMNVRIIVEGVETIADVILMRQLGCFFAQGFFFSRPMKGDELKQYITNINKHDGNDIKKIQKSNSYDDFTVIKKETNIVIVDPNMKNKNSLTKMISKYYNVYSFVKGKEALEFSKNAKMFISTFICPGNLEQTQGFNFIEAIRGVPFLNQIPIILSNVTKTEGEMLLVKYCADYIITKPYNQSLILHKISKTAEKCKFIYHEEKLVNEELLLSDKAYKDELTGLLNRHGLYFRLDSGEKGINYSLLMVDIDNLKTCNDVYGHLYGDLLIKSISQLLFSEFRSQDIVARFGGDEFIVVVKNLDSKNVLLEKCRDLNRKVNEMLVDDLDCTFSCSIGCAVHHSTESFEDVMKRADFALYEVKHSTKNSCKFGEFID
jgi:c-di-GMP phosphodiesterase